MNRFTLLPLQLIVFQGSSRRLARSSLRKQAACSGEPILLFFIAARSVGNKNGHGRRPANNYIGKIAAKRLFFIAEQSAGNKNGYGRRPANNYIGKIAAKRLFFIAKQSAGNKNGYGRRPANKIS